MMIITSQFGPSIILQRLQQLGPLPPPPRAALAFQRKLYCTRHLLRRRRVLIPDYSAVDHSQHANSVLLPTRPHLAHHGDHHGHGKRVGPGLLLPLGHRTHELQRSQCPLGGGPIEIRRRLNHGTDGACLDGDAAVPFGQAKREEYLGGGFGSRGKVECGDPIGVGSGVGRENLHCVKLWEVAEEEEEEVVDDSHSALIEVMGGGGGVGVRGAAAPVGLRTV
ncbi:U-box domain-containing protein 26 [Senna tora]|uniref:U-box domain-containing protein 26 n=1 Tax=Senna tora TaxID=362788 RepID=A0A834TY40_9FABA|nr:U-box domain-containing protein 26 [Senna tora]